MASWLACPGMPRAPGTGPNLNLLGLSRSRLMQGSGLYSACLFCFPPPVYFFKTALMPPSDWEKLRPLSSERNGPSNSPFWGLEAADLAILVVTDEAGGLL